MKTSQTNKKEVTPAPLMRCDSGDLSTTPSANAGRSELASHEPLKLVTIDVGPERKKYRIHKGNLLFGQGANNGSMDGL